MKRLLFFAVFNSWVLSSFSQAPDYYYYFPSNVGVNNLYLNTVISYKFLFIYTQTELASTGISGPMVITSIWLKSNTATTITVNDIIVSMGHSTYSIPTGVFATNFDVGAPDTVLDQSSLNISFLGAPWNSPPDDWTEIPLTTPFYYDFTNNLVIQVEYSNCSYPIPIYADNGITNLTILTDTLGSATSNSTTARPMLGVSSSQTPLSAWTVSDAAICEKFCVDFQDGSNNNPTAWQWTFDGGTPSISVDPDPTGICYNNPGTYDVTLITTNSFGSDSLTLTGYITVYPTPPLPTITQSGNLLTSTSADAYQWQFNAVDIPGATNQAYTATQSGLYTAVITDNNGCSSSASQSVDVVGIENTDEPVSFNIFPNPSQGNFFIVMNTDPSSNATVEILNCMGQVVASEQIHFTGKKSGSGIQFRTAASGMYTVRIHSDDNWYYHKLIISSR